MKKVFWDALIVSKHGLGKETNFDMQYIPNYDTKTYGAKPDVTSYLQLKKMSNMERKNLLILVSVCSVFALLLVFIFILLRLCLGASETAARLSWQESSRASAMARDSRRVGSAFIGPARERVPIACGLERRSS